LRELVFKSMTIKFVKVDIVAGRGPRNKFEFKYKYFKRDRDPS
jgi:hypothetical protein